MSAMGYFGLTIFNIIFAILGDNSIIGRKPILALDGTSQMQLSAVILGTSFLTISTLAIPLIMFLPRSYFPKNAK